MKLRHAVTLALVGWYLMIPPLTKKGPDSYGLPPDTTAPLAKWIYARTDHFDTEEECKMELNSRQELAARGLGREGWASRFGRSWGTALAGLWEEQQKLGRCVPDTDPGIERD